MVRAKLLEAGSLPAGKLHKLAVARVSAAAQARFYDALEAVLCQQERDILRRGRNANSARAPKSCTYEDYRRPPELRHCLAICISRGIQSGWRNCLR